MPALLVCFPMKAHVQIKITTLLGFGSSLAGMDIKYILCVCKVIVYALLQEIKMFRHSSLPS